MSATPQAIIISEPMAKQNATWSDAISILEETLKSGFDPEGDPMRSRLDTFTGEFFLMPSWTNKYVGLKVLTSTPANQARRMPLIYGTYNLFNAEFGYPLAYIDGGAITNLRTASLSTMVIKKALRKNEKIGRAHV